MHPEHVGRAQVLFEQAAALPQQDRAGFLARECGEDCGLRARVESLLNHDQQARQDEFMRLPELAETIAHVAPPAAPSPIPEIDGYAITREIDRGGQGVVFQAIQISTRRKVAIKVLREGPYASQTSRRRFERELALVASLKHPNIISIFHSGATRDGSQFFVMDYVRGAPLHEHVRARKATVEAALRLFLEMCDAIQYAHQKGIIHRDLKPTNVIVDNAGAPHILDFGLAKTVAGPDGSLLTLTREILGTPAYMAPEQFAGNPESVDTRSDVYALGVMLFELLTGHHPFALDGGLSKIMQRVTESEPTPPARAWTPDLGVTRSTTRRLRDGQCPIDHELTTIVMKAIAREPQRRYQSVGELAADLRHYLAGEPIAAKRDSHWYVLRKTLRRHRAAVISSATFVVFLIGSCIALAVMYQQQHRERTRAESERRRAETTWKFLAGMFELMDPAELRSSPDRYAAMKQVLDGAAAQVDGEMQVEPRETAKLHETVGRSYERLGCTAPAKHAYERAVKLRRARRDWEPIHLARSLRRLGAVCTQAGEHDQAGAALTEAIRVCESAHPPNPAETIAALRDYARSRIDAGDLERASASAEDALVRARKEFGDHHAEVACCLTDVATVHQRRGNVNAAESTLIKALETRERIGAGDGAVASSLNNLAYLLLADGRLEAAAERFAKAGELAGRALNPKSELALDIRAGAATCLVRTGRYDEAEESLLFAYDGLKKAVGERAPLATRAASAIDELYRKWSKPDKLASWRSQFASGERRR